MAKRNTAYMEMAFFGPWAKANTFTKKLPWSIKASAIYGMKKATDRIVKAVKQHISTQSPPEGVIWEPLSERTIAKKGHSDFFVDTMQYYNAIESWREGYIYYAGIKRGQYNQNGIELSAVANELEVGNRKKKIPARPLWGPTMQEHGGVAGMRGIVLDVLLTKIAQDSIGAGWMITPLTKIFS